MTKTFQSQEFYDYYLDIYGSDWPSILKSFSVSPFKVNRLNKFSNLNSEVPSDLHPFSEIPGCFIAADKDGYTESVDFVESFYKMDPASVAVALNFCHHINNEDRSDLMIGDLCAAPGGKSIILIENLYNSSHFVLNDISRKRVFKLKNIVNRYVPEKAIERVKFSNRDVGTWSRSNKSFFDGILLDVPCSAERHLVNDEKEMLKWTSKRTKQISQKQYRILAGAIEMLKPGGHITYSTCSISPLENDEVIRRILKKKKNVSINTSLKYIGRSTEFGVFVLPELTNYGPIYYCSLKKNA